MNITLKMPFLNHFKFTSNTVRKRSGSSILQFICLFTFPSSLQNIHSVYFQFSEFVFQLLKK